MMRSSSRMLTKAARLACSARCQNVGPSCSTAICPYNESHAQPRRALQHPWRSCSISSIVRCEHTEATASSGKSESSIGACVTPRAACDRAGGGACPGRSPTPPPPPLFQGCRSELKFAALETRLLVPLGNTVSVLSHPQKSVSDITKVLNKVKVYREIVNAKYTHFVVCCGLNDTTTWV